MSSGARSLIVALAAGLLFAVLLQQILPPAQLPNVVPEAAAIAAAMLKNPLQIARQGVRAVRGYKSSPTTTTSLFSQPLTIPPRPGFPPVSLGTPISTSSCAMASTKSFLQAIQDRRTIYALNKTAPKTDSEIVALVKEAVLHVPSSFNSQSARLVVLLNEEHDKFWDFVLEVLKPIVPEEQFPSTEQRVSGFRAGYGTILFFEDPEPVAALQKAFAIYAHHFPDWSEHTSAMHQYALWVALEAEGFGANLQHYNPIIDRKAQENWNIPLDWKLRAQLVFGGKAGEPGKKEFKPVEGERLFVHGAKN